MPDGSCAYSPDARDTKLSMGFKDSFLHIRCGCGPLHFRSCVACLRHFQVRGNVLMEVFGVAVILIHRYRTAGWHLVWVCGDYWKMMKEGRKKGADVACAT